MDKFIDRTNGNILFVETTTEVSKHANGDMLETNIRLRERMTNDCLGYAQFVCSLLDMSHPAGISMFATVNMRPFNEPQEETLSDFIAQAAFFENKTYLPIKSKIDGLGRVLLSECIAELVKQQCEMLVIVPMPSSIEFYRKELGRIKKSGGNVLEYITHGEKLVAALRSGQNAVYG